jgi:K+-transporting ATPase KdpF subunit
MDCHEDVRGSYGGQIRRSLMSWLYLISGIIALALLIYLFIALLKPEMLE